MALLKTIGNFSIFMMPEIFFIPTSFVCCFCLLKLHWKPVPKWERSICYSEKNLTKRSVAEICVRQFDFSPIVLFAGDYFISWFWCLHSSAAISWLRAWRWFVPIAAADPGGCCVFSCLFSAITLLLRQITSSTQVCALGNKKRSREGNWGI